MSGNDYLHQIGELVGKDELPHAIELLQRLLQNSSKLDEVILHSARLNDLSQQIRKGTIDYDHANITKNQIRLAILQIVAEIEESISTSPYIEHEVSLYTKKWQAEHSLGHTGAGDNVRGDKTVYSGRDNITAGGNVTIKNIENRKAEGELEITNIGFTHDAEFDVKIRNLGDIAIIINMIEIAKLEAPGISVCPILKPSAKYIIPVDDIKVGESKSLSISHYVDANKADRILIATKTTTVYRLKVTFYYNKDKSVSFIKNTW